MKKKPQETKASLTGSTLSIFAPPSQTVPSKAPGEIQPLKEHLENPGTFWELLYDADLRVVTEPWPPKQGPARLKAEITPTDGGGKFEGTVAYRIAKTKHNSVAWQPFPKVSKDKHGSVFFEAPIALGKGRVYIQFPVRGAGEEAYNKESIDLTDWEVEVK